jgi:hypothetical protein
MSGNLDIKLRLGEITRRSAELSEVSSRLADLALQLNRLRKLNDDRIELLGSRDRIPRPNHDRHAYKFLGNGWDAT